MPEPKPTVQNRAASAKRDAIAGTLRDPFEDEALRSLGSGVRQYLAIRSAHPSVVNSAFAAVKSEVAAHGADWLREDPGPKARLYRVARDVIQKLSSRPAAHTLPWHRANAQEDATASRWLRFDGSDRELLELRHVRGLSVPEIAFAVDQGIGVVAGRLNELELELAMHAPEDLPRTLQALLSPAPTSAFADEEPMVPAGTVLDARYELLKHIGSGGFADVYQARDIGVPGHFVAIKLLKRKAGTAVERDRALRELRLIAAVFHPSIVQFKDHGWFEDRFWFVMPWYEGETLERRMIGGRLSRPEAQDIFVPLARALAVMHAAGVRHQDIKPDNIFLAKLRGEEQRVLPVLLDLGVAATDEDLMLAGTPTYFAPEVAAHFSFRDGAEPPKYPIGEGADVFALALSLRNALEPESQPDIGPDVDAFIRERATQTPSNVSREELRYLRPYFKRWLAMDPAERPTASQFAAELAELTAPEEKRARRLRALRVYGPIIASLLVLFGVVSWSLKERAEVEAERARMEEARANATEEKAAILEQERNSAQSSRDEAQAEADALAGRISEAESRIRRERLSSQALVGRLASASGQLEVARANLSQRERELDEKRKALEQAIAERDRVTGELSRTNGRLTESQSLVALRQSELASTERRVSELQASVSSAERARGEAEVVAAERARSLASAEDARREAEQTTHRLERELNAARAEIARLERELGQRSSPIVIRSVAPNLVEQ